MTKAGIGLLVLLAVACRDKAKPAPSDPARAARGLPPSDPGAARPDPGPPHGETLTLIDGTLLAVPGSFAISADATEVAFVTRQGGRQAVVATDRKSDDRFDNVDASSLTFSEDGQHLAFAALDGAAALVVRDGQRGPVYQGIARTTLHWSPDGKRLAYAGVKAHQQLAVIDGRESAPYDVIMENTPGFDPTSARVAYGAQRGKSWFVVIDGEPGPSFEGIGAGGVRFSPSGKAFAYMGFDGQAQHVIVDGKADPPVGALWTQGPVFRPGDERVAYGAKLASGWGVVIGGEVVAQQPWVFDVLFDRTGRHLLYAGAQEGSSSKQFVVVDGKIGPLEDGVSGMMLEPGGVRYAYAARSSGRWHVVLDGQAQPAYDELAAGSMVFSPDGKRFAYAARRGRSWFVVEDGQEGLPLGAVLQSSLSFSPDSRHLAFGYVDPAGKVFVRTDRVTSQPWDTVRYGSKGLRFDARGVVHYAAGVGYEMYRVAQSPGGP